MSAMTAAELALEYERTFGEKALSAAKAWVGDAGIVDTSRPAQGVVWSKWGAATAAIRNATVGSCISKRKSAIAGLKWEVIDNASGDVIGASDDYDSAEAVSMLMHRFARRNDGKSLFGEMQEHKAITGEAYVELIRHPVDRVTVTDIEFINSLSVDPITYNGTDIEYFQYSGNDGSIKLLKQNVIYDRYTKNLFTEIHGYSPLMTLIGDNVIGVMEAAGRSMLSYWNNDGLPRAVISPKIDPTTLPWDEQEMAQIRSTLSRNKGAGNRYKLAIFPFPFDSVVFNDPDLQKWSQLLDSLKPDIFLAFNVPRSIAGDSDSQRLQASPQDIENWHDWITEEAKALEGVWNTRFVPAIYGHTRPPVTFKFDLTPYERKESQEAILDRMARGAITINEARRKMGEPEFPEGEVLMLNSSVLLVRPDQLGMLQPKPSYQPFENPSNPIVEGGSPTDAPAQLTDGVQAGATVDADKATGTPFTVALDLANHPDLIALQQQAKAKMSGLAVEWNAPDTFHVTIAHVPAADAELQAAMLEAVQTIPLPPLSLSVGSLNAFRGVEAWALHFRIPRNVDLLNYQAAVYDALEALGAPLSAYSEPSAWKPHITIGYAAEKPPTVTYRAGFTVKPDGIVIWNGDETAYRSADADMITPETPLAVTPPTKTYPLPSDALGEVEGWRVVARRQGASKAMKFITIHLDPDLAAHVRYGLRDGDMTVFDRVSAAVRGELPPVMPDDVKALCDARLTHLQDVGLDDFELKTFALGVLAAKAIQTTRADFEANVETLLFEAVEGTLRNAQFQGRMRSLLQTTIYRAYVDGLRDGGVDDLPTETDDAWITAHISEQYQYVRGIAEAIYKDDRVTEEEAAGKPELWWNKSVYPAYVAGVESAAKDALLEWTVDAAKENCDSCLALSGQRRRASFWRRNVQPKADGLQCGGFRCGCGFKVVSGAASKGKLPRWRFAKSANVDEIAEAHDHAHETP